MIRIQSYTSIYRFYLLTLDAQNARTGRGINMEFPYTIETVFSVQKKLPLHYTLFTLSSETSLATFAMLLALV